MNRLFDVIFVKASMHTSYSAKVTPCIIISWQCFCRFGSPMYNETQSNEYISRCHEGHVIYHVRHCALSRGRMHQHVQGKPVRQKRQYPGQCNFPSLLLCHVTLYQQSRDPISHGYILPTHCYNRVRHYPHRIVVVVTMALNKL